MRSPFSLSPNPILLYTPPGLLGSLDKIRFMIAERQGLALILGDAGMGKSSVLRYLLAEYSAEGYTTGMVYQTEFPSPYAFMKEICSQFGIEAKRSLVAQHKALEQYLVGEFRSDRTVVLFIDEGQRLNADLLEVIRALLNFETYEDKLLQIVLAGTLEMRDRILAKRNKALRSRVFAPCLLNQLSAEETAAMIQFRCDRSGIKNPFDDEGCERIFVLSHGTPRAILLICSHAWNLARKMKITKVPIELIQAASVETSIPTGEAA
jgi:type II secretory pathway predicted ATPase ExeA